MAKTREFAKGDRVIFQRRGKTIYGVIVSMDENDLLFIEKENGMTAVVSASKVALRRGRKPRKG